MGGTCNMNEGEEKHMLLVEKSEGNTSGGKPKCGWVDNIKMDLKEIRWGGVDWIGLVQYMERWRALVNAVMNI
jgi:hypothetical protein